MNTIIEFLVNFAIGTISTFGFAIFMYTPKRCAAYAGITGGFGWLFYTILTNFNISAVIASFFAACLVGVFGEVFARVLKVPSIVFVVPGMLPLAPGRGLFYTMESLIAKEYMQSISHGTTTLAIAGAISLGIILITSLARTVTMNTRRVCAVNEDETAEKINLEES